MNINHNLLHISKLRNWPELARKKIELTDNWPKIFISIDFHYLHNQKFFFHSSNSVPFIYVHKNFKQTLSFHTCNSNTRYSSNTSEKITNWRRKKMRVDRLFARCKLNRNTRCVLTEYIRLRIVMRLLLVSRYEAVAGDPTRYRHNYTHVFYLVENRLYFVLLLLLLLLPSSPPSS